MEDDLDRIAAGDEDRVAWLTRFYKGRRRRSRPAAAGHRPPGRDRRPRCELDLAPRHRHRRPRRPVRPVPRARRGACIATRRDRARRAHAGASRGAALPSRRPSGRSESIRTRDDPIVVRTGRYGPYVTEELPDESDEKPRTASLFASMEPETVTLEDALRLLSLPRAVGVDPADGEEIVATNGRYGPFIKKGSETRSLDAEEQLFTLTVDEALTLLAQPKQRAGVEPPRRHSASSAPTRRPGSRSSSRTAVSVPTSPTARRTRACAAGDSVESLTLERAVELLADRRSRGPAKRRQARRRSSQPDPSRSFYTWSAHS